MSWGWLNQTGARTIYTCPFVYGLFVVINEQTRNEHVSRRGHGDVWKKKIVVNERTRNERAMRGSHGIV